MCVEKYRLLIKHLNIFFIYFFNRTGHLGVFCIYVNYNINKVLATYAFHINRSQKLEW